MIRRCELKDKEIWVELNKDFICYEYQNENAWNNPLNYGNLGEDFECILQKDFAALLFFVIENEEIVGFMNVQQFYSVWSHGEVFLLDDFFISEKYRGKGYGSKALEDLEKYARSISVKRIELLAENTNPKAIEFYTKMNYKKQEVNLFLKYLPSTD